MTFNLKFDLSAEAASPDEMDFYSNNAEAEVDSYKTVEFEDGVPLLDEFVYVNEVSAQPYRVRPGNRNHGF